VLLRPLKTACGHVPNLLPCCVRRLSSDQRLEFIVDIIELVLSLLQEGALFSPSKRQRMTTSWSQLTLGIQSSAVASESSAKKALYLNLLVEVSCSLSPSCVHPAAGQVLLKRCVHQNEIDSAVVSSTAVIVSLPEPGVGQRQAMGTLSVFSGPGQRPQPLQTES